MACLCVSAAILILYLINWLDFDDSKATSIYHSFVVLCYFSPVLGAIIADGYLGRYRSHVTVYICCKFALMIRHYQLQYYY